MPKAKKFKKASKKNPVTLTQTPDPRFAFPKTMEDDSSQEDLTEEDEGVASRHSPPSPFGLVPRPPHMGSEDDEDEDEFDKRLGHAHADDDRPSKERRRKPGILFLSSIPHGYNVSMTTSFFSQFGQVGRVFLKPGY